MYIYLHMYYMHILKCILNFIKKTSFASQMPEIIKLFRTGKRGYAPNAVILYVLPNQLGLPTNSFPV